MQSQSIRIVSVLTLVFMLRIFGLMLILPVIQSYQYLYVGSTPWLIGMVVGIYGLVQACFQLPLGVLSDRIGRKKVMMFGLGLFVLGSYIGVYAHSVYGLIVARAVQGSGAIGSVVMAAIADHTSEAQRTLAMAFFGGMIGLSFFLAIILAPILAAWLGFSGLFALMLVCALVAFILVVFMVPEQVTSDAAVPVWTILYRCWQPTLVPNYFGIWALHAWYTAWFLQFSSWLMTRINLPLVQHSALYAMALGASVIIAGLMIMFAERRGYGQSMRYAAWFAFLLSSVIACWFGFSYGILLCALVLFFAGFCYFESILPSHTSQLADARLRGSVMGVFSSCQFFGIFSGSMLLHAFNGWFGSVALPCLCVALVSGWWTLHYMADYGVDSPKLRRTFS